MPLPGEPPLAAPLNADLAKVADLRTQVLALSGQGRNAEAVRLEKQALDAAMHAARERLDLLIAYDANQAAQLGEQIHAWHRRSGQVALGLDALVALLTIGVAVLALRKLGRARDRLERENRQLEARGLELEEFSGRMAHDVLSPLFTAGIGWELARKLYPDDERLARLAETGRAAIQRSRRLVEDLLAFSLAGNKGAGGTAELSLVVADVVANLESESDAARVQLVADPAPAAHIACSSGVLTSILLNLVRNAIKHMDGAEVRRIEIHHRLTPETLHCEVADTGPGIAFEDQRAIFEPYVRGTTKAAGIGLGLATVKRLVEGHGGAVGVRSAPGHGATFWFELPLVPSEQDQPTLQ
jgi:signal transduction histidine kinase